MKRSVRIEYSHLVRCQQLGGHRFHGDFLSILPKLRLRIEQGIRRILIDLPELHNALNFHRVVPDEFPVGHQVIAVDANRHVQPGLDGVGIVIPGDVGGEVLKQRALVHAGRFRVGCHDGLDLIR